MTYDEAIAWWYGRIDFERRAPRRDDLRLEPMRALLRRLGDPHQRLRLVHVAGSKGKGSTAAMLAAVLRAAGYRTGLFTSPHLSAVEERIRLDDRPITKLELAALLTDIRTATGHDLTPTFFEINTAAGFLHFQRLRADVSVVEVGLGGRFDSTNVITPLVSIITSISFDHTAVLGNSLESIAFEKAGIVKPRRPVVSGAGSPEANAVIRRVCLERRAPLTEIGRDVEVHYTPGRVADGERPRVKIATRAGAWPELELGLLGAHQATNAAVVVATVERLRELGLHLPARAVAAGLAHVVWPARMEILRRAPWVVLDCAHNVASAEALANALRESFPAGRRLLVFASSSDKDIAGILRHLSGEVDGAYLTRFANSPRAVAPQRLAELWREVSAKPSKQFDDAASAWRAALSDARSGDLIIVTGSVFLAGELRPLMMNLS